MHPFQVHIAFSVRVRCHRLYGSSKFVGSELVHLVAYDRQQMLKEKQRTHYFISGEFILIV